MSASAAAWAPRGLVAAYGFEEGSGSQVADASGYGNVGTIANATWVDSGAYGGALSFNGSDAVVTVDDSPSLHLRRAMTLEAWVKPSTVGGDWRDVVYKGNDAYYLEASSQADGLPMGGGSFTGAGGEGQVFGDDWLPTGAWSYFAVTYDGSMLRLYVDGKEVASKPQSGMLVASHDPLQIGGDHIFGQYFEGTIDEVRVYDVALAPDAIQKDMVTPVGAGTSGDQEPPSAPGGLAASAVGPGEVDLSWTEASDNVGVAGYDVFRCQGAGCSDFTQLAMLGAVTGYKDTSVAAATSYTYRVRAFDAAGNDGPFSDVAEATTPAPSGGAGPGPISVGPTGRYLVDENGKPFLIAGDSPQALIGNLSLADAESFFADRQALGFNSVWVNLLCTTYTGCRAGGSTWDGIAPFTTPGDLSTPNEQYFARVDETIRLAAKYGLVVILDPAETGGWLDTLIANGVDKDRAYGRYLGERYKNFPNIIWMSGNDYQSWGPTNDPYVTAVAQGIKDTDPGHIQTVQLNFMTSGSLDDPAWAPLISLNASYTYAPTYEQVLTDYNRSNFLPTFMVEGTYEFEQNAAEIPYGDPFALRRQEYWSMLSGATGQLYGNHYTWQFLCDQRDQAGNCVGGWKDHLDTTGAIEFKHMTDLFQSLPWYQLVPDSSHTLLIGGNGNYGDWDYATAAKTPDGTLALAYIPTARTVTVDLGTMAGPVTARWYDPANGTYNVIAGSPFANQGTEDFTTPGDNADGPGNADWVLVLEAH
jgi:Protein of unknown function (DUF4038)/Concanavalin A-like lectin/glucanases superfamily/Putative collagen-binding domain of a collagenase